MDKLDIPQEEVDALVKELAVLLSETKRAPIKQIKKIIQYCGTDFARQVYKDTLQVEANGGMRLVKEERRRTIGGVFFFLAREKLSEEQRQVIFPPFKNYQKANSRTPLGIPLLNWKERIAIVETLKNDQGEMKSMKVTLSGRPGSIEKRGEVVVTTMTDIPLPQNIPRIIPRPPNASTLYTVYIWTKQWEKIEESMADPADIMLLDGVCAFDPETNSLAIFAANVYSELLNAKAKEAAAAAKPVKQPKQPKQPKEAKEAKPTSDKAPKAKAPAPAQPQVQGKEIKKSRYDDVQSEPVAAAVPLNPNLPPDVARKLNELNASAALFRQKVNNLLSKPPGQQFGLEMTQKLLKNVEDEISALKQKHNV